MTDSARARQWGSIGWALLPLLIGIPAAPCFAWAAYRTRRRALAVEAGVYAVVTVTFFVLAAQSGTASTASGYVGIALMLVATARAFMVRREVFAPHAAATTTTVASSAAPAEPVTWTPPTPEVGTSPAPFDHPFACTGHDQHALSLPIARTIPMAVGGAMLTYVDVRVLHVSGRGLGFGIALMLMPVLSALFSRRVDGPTLYYRVWGAQRSLRLDQVTTVTTSPRGQSLVLRAPGTAHAVTVGIRAPHYSMPPAARDHLRGWLERPGVSLSPAATALLQGQPVGGASARTHSRRTKVAINVVSIVVVVLPLAIAGWLYLHPRTHPINGAHGYFTAAGPHGKAFAVGRPWGTPCQPVLFQVTPGVSDEVYRQLVTVVDEAHADGLNVTTEDRSYRWQLQAVTIPPGEPPSALPQVAVDVRTGTPPRLSSGRRERVGFGWNARVDGDGHHEDLTYFDAHLYLQALPDPAAQRTALREVVAFAEGVSRTTAADSGMRHGATRDSFSPSDVHALRVMSGCGS